MAAHNINSLPTEILTAIIIEHVHVSDPRNFIEPFTTFYYSTPLRLVSKRWNAIIISNPRFWTNLRVAITLPSGSKGPITPSVLSAWLNRSGTLPLHMTLWLHAGTQKATLEILDVLRPSVHRWASVELCPDVLPTTVLDLPFADAGILQSFSIRRVCRYGNTFTIAPLAAIPKLRIFKLNNIDDAHIYHMLRTLKMVLRNLTQLELGCANVGLDNIRAVFQECVSATRIMLALRSVCTLMSSDVRSRLTLPNLRVLELYVDRDNVKLFPLNIISAPSLSLLSITGTPSREDLPSMLHTYISQWNHRLHVLRLSAIKLGGELATFLKSPAIMLIPKVEVQLAAGTTMETALRRPWGTTIAKPVRVAADVDDELLPVLGWMDSAQVPPSLIEYFSEPTTKPLNKLLISSD